MRPSRVRKRIIKEHEALGQRLEILERLAERLENEGATALGEARSQAREFYELLLDHIDLEDDILAPALRNADAWGKVRADTLLKHHREQREELEDLTRGDREAPPPELAARLRRVIEDVRQDMRHEEDEILTMDILRDDVIGIDVEGG